MTIEEIYKWAVKNDCEDKEFAINADWHRFFINSLELDENGEVVIGEW